MPYPFKPLSDIEASQWALEYTVTQLQDMRRCGVCGVPLMRSQNFCTLCVELYCSEPITNNLEGQAK